MALINCPECDGRVSDVVKRCPQCGFLIKKKRGKKIGLIILGLIILVVAIALMTVVYPRVRDTIIRREIESKTNSFMSDIKSGLSDEQYSEIEVEILEYSIRNGVLSQNVAQTIYDYLDEQDIADIYEALIKHMDYEIQEIERIDKDYYRETIKIQNVDIKAVVATALDNKVEDYTEVGFFGKIYRGIHDFNTVKNGDYSRTIADEMIKASNTVAENMPIDSVSTVFTIKIRNQNKEWKIKLDESDKKEFIKGCCGIAQ